MRTLLLGIALLATACTDSTLGEDTAYRRLVDTYDSYDQCLSTGNGNVCYQTLTFCSDGFARIDLENRPEDGSYTLESSDSAVAKFSRLTVIFDLDSGRSGQLPGRAWERVAPEFYDCMTE
jgi:hypothetical protein